MLIFGNNLFTTVGTTEVQDFVVVEDYFHIAADLEEFCLSGGRTPLILRLFLIFEQFFYQLKIVVPIKRPTIPILSLRTIRAVTSFFWAGWTQLHTTRDRIEVHLFGCLFFQLAGVPPLQLMGAFVVRVNINLAVLVTAVQALAIVVRDPGPSNREHLVLLIGIESGVLSPETDLNCQLRLVHYCHVPSVFHRAWLFYVHLGDRANRMYDAYRVNCAHLLEFVYLVDTSETKSETLDCRVVTHRFNMWILVEYYWIVVLDAGVLSISHIHFPVGEQIDLVLLQLEVIVVGLVIEKGRLNLRALIIY